MNRTVWALAAGLALSLPGLASDASRGPAPGIEGQVLDLQGVPVAQARVSLLAIGPRPPEPPRDPADRQPRTRSVHQARTNERGDFLLVPGSPGLFRVRVEAPGGASAVTDPLPIVESFRLPAVQVDSSTSRRDPTRPELWAPWGYSSPAARDGEPSPRKVTGRVVEAATGEPLAGALVWQVDREERSGVTDAEGRFSLEVDAQVEVHLAAVGAGYLMARRHLADPAAAVTLALPPGHAASGSVVDPAGRAVEGARIDLLSPRGAPGDPRASTASDRRGRFRLCCLATGGSGTLSATKERHTTQRLPVRSDGDGPPAVRLVLAPGRPVTGTVLGPDGTGIRGARVALRSESSRRAATLQAETGDDGRFRLDGVPFGRYLLTAVASGWPAASVPGVEVAPGTGEAVLGTLYLARGVDLDGEVVDREDVPVEGAVIRARPSESGDEPSVEVEATTGPDGRFRLQGLDRATPVDLEASAEGHAPELLASIRLPSPEPLRIVLGPGLGLRGVVIGEGGEPVPDAAVRLVPREEAGSVTRVTSTDLDGRFHADGLAPGEVDVLVAAHGYAPSRTVVDLDPEVVLEELEIQLARGGAVRGVVSTPSGGPATEALVEAVRSDPATGTPSEHRTTSTDGSGRFSLEGLEPGRWWLSAQAPGFLRSAEGVEVTGNDPAAEPVELSLEAGAQVSGRALDASGEPVAGARIELVPAPTVRRPYPMFRPEPPPVAVTGPDGGFRLTGAGRGEYRLRGSHPAYGQAEAPEPVRVDGASIEGLALYLETGGSVAGRLLGLGLEELHQVRVAAIGEDPAAGRQVVRGEVRPDGSYRISGLAPGRWSVVASISDTGIATTEAVVVAAAAQETSLDLDLGGALEEAGTATRRFSRRKPAPDH